MNEWSLPLVTRYSYIMARFDRLIMAFALCITAIFWQDLKCWLWSLYNTLQVYIGKIWKFLLWPLCHTLKLYCCQIWKTLAFQPAITATCIMWQYVKGRINWLWHPLWALHGIYMARCARKHVHDMHVIHVEPWNNNTVCVLRPCVEFVCVCEQPEITGHMISSTHSSSTSRTQTNHLLNTRIQTNQWICMPLP